MTQAAQEQPWPKPAYAWYVLAIICFGYVFAFIDRIIVGLLTPAIQADLGISDTQVGLLQGLAFALFYTLFGLPLGWMTDRTNRKVMLGWGMTVWSSMTAACGLVSGFWPLFLCRVGVGIGEATLNPCASSLISDYFEPKKRSRAFGFYTMSTAFASVFTYLIGGLVIAGLAGYAVISLPLLGDLKPWQVTFIAVGLPGLIPALLFFLTVREPARRGLAKAAAHGGAPAAATWQDTKDFLTANRKALVCILVGAALVILEIYGAAYWTPTYFLRAHGWQPQDTAFYVGIPQGIAGGFGALTFGVVTEWFRRRGHTDAVWMTCFLGALGCTLFGTIGPLMPTAELAVALFILKSLFVNYSPAAALTAINEITPNQHRGLVTALYVILTGLFAQGLGPFSVGLASDYVFADPSAIGQSLALVVAGTGVIGMALLAYGRSAYRVSVAAVTWEAPAIAKA